MVEGDCKLEDLRSPGRGEPPRPRRYEKSANRILEDRGLARRYQWRNYMN